MAYHPHKSSFFAHLLRLFAALLERWPLVVVALFFISSEGPHLRVAWSYTRSEAAPHFISCTYLGSRGLVPGYVPGCPWVVWMDSRAGE